MQSTVFMVTLALMAFLAAACLRTIWATENAGSQRIVNNTRSALLWFLVTLGIVVSIASLRDWPNRSASSDALIVNISSGQWWWDTDTTEIPLGQEVEFRVTSEDVNHGLGIYDPSSRLVVQVQAMPTYTNKVVHTFEETGTYSILCMEFCGVAHHAMTYEFEVVEKAQ